MISVLLALTITSPSAHSDAFDDTFDRECLKIEKSKCGSASIDTSNPNLTDEQREILACRIKALKKCLRGKK